MFRIIWFLWVFLPSVAFADDVSLGQLSTNLMGPVSVLAELLYKICYVLGAMFILGSVLQYKNHRDNPSQIPISRPILLLVFGLIFIGFPFFAQLSSGAPKPL